MSITTNATIASFGGKLLKLAHNASTVGCEMKFNLYLPPQASKQKVPLLIWLSGLTCTADNCSEKGFFQHGASKHGIAILYPDTSPRMFRWAQGSCLCCCTDNCFFIQVVSRSKERTIAMTSAPERGFISTPLPALGRRITRCMIM